jgi:hypothetical protein
VISSREMTCRRQSSLSTASIERASPTSLESASGAAAPAWQSSASAEMEVSEQMARAPSCFCGEESPLHGMALVWIPLDRIPLEGHRGQNHFRKAA